MSEKEELILKLLNLFVKSCENTKSNDTKEFIYRGKNYIVLENDFNTLCKTIDYIKKG